MKNEDMETLKREIGNEIAIMFREWDCMDVATLQETLTERVADDVVETSDYPNHNSSDIRIAIQRVVMQQIVYYNGRRVYVVVVRDKNVITDTSSCYDSYQKARKSIYDKIAPFAYCREVKESRNHFVVTDKEGKYIHTLEILEMDEK